MQWLGSCSDTMAEEPAPAVRNSMVGLKVMPPFFIVPRVPVQHSQTKYVPGIIHQPEKKWRAEIKHHLAHKKSSQPRERNVHTSYRSRSRSWSAVDHVVPQLPLWEVVKDLQSTDPTKETCATVVVDHANYTGPIRQHELLIDHTRSRTDLPCLADPDHGRGNSWSVRDVKSCLYVQKRKTKNKKGSCHKTDK